MNYKLSALIINFFLLYLNTSWSQDTTQVNTIDEIEFVVKRIYRPEMLTLHIRDFKRLPASFDDPAKVLFRFPGFANDNDQNNSIIYHGLPAHFMGWQLNGLDIVNPNHLANAGGLNDQSSFTAGGINMLSGNVINRYEYLAPTQLGLSNYLAGASNVVIDSLPSSFYQISLIGLETGLKYRQGKHHQLFGSLRYSFTGLLDAFGVPLGDEKVNYYDAVLGYSYENDLTKISALLIGGKSSNIHNSLDSITKLKDALDIEYRSKNIITQLLFEQKLGSRIILKLGASYSNREDHKNSNGIVYFQNDSILINQENNNSQKIVTLRQELKIGSNLSIGFKEMFNKIKIKNKYGNPINGDLLYSDWFVSPFIQYQKDFRNTKLQIDLSAIIQAQEVRMKFTPKIALEQSFGKSNKIRLSVGKSAQQMITSMKQFEYLLLKNIELNYQYTSKVYDFSIGGFYHHILDLPATNGFYSPTNNLDYFIEAQKGGPYTNAESKGIVVGVQPHLGKGYWININTTLFDISYKNHKGEQSKAFTNYKSLMNFNLGKEIRLKKNVLTISSAIHMRGGSNQHPIIEQNLFSTFDYNYPAQTVVLGKYFKMDFRINYITSKSMWSLDIQNVTSKKNDAFLSYDLNGPTIQKGLGIVPVLTYRRSL